MNIIDDPTEYFGRFAKRKTPKKLPPLSPVEQLQIATKKTRRGGNAYRYTKTGYRKDINDTDLLRSAWEADLSRICLSYSIPYKYEPQPFFFPVRQKTKGYLPDFRIGTAKKYEWLELKGWLTGGASVTKLRRFRIYYPDEFAKLTLVINKTKKNIELCEKLQIPQVMFWRDINHIYGPIISNWESN